jgi:hypothetical protein
MGRSAASRHLEDLHSNGMVVKHTRPIRKGFSDVTYRLNPGSREAIHALLLIYVRMNQYDKAFYTDGHRHADRIISNSSAFNIMMQRVALTDERMAKSVQTAPWVIDLARRNVNERVDHKDFYH